MMAGRRQYAPRMPPAERRQQLGRWESSSDGSSWQHDFDLTYTKVT